MSFAEALTRVVASKQRESREHERLADRWRAKEAELLEALVQSFKNRCLREAEQLRCGATISFAVLCREVEEVPRHVVSDSTYLVKDWGDCSAECWFYARHGASATWSPGTRVLYAELLESMMSKFVERLDGLGFETCTRDSGTWKVTATWQLPDTVQPKATNGNVSMGENGKVGHSAANSAPPPPIPASSPSFGASGASANGAATAGRLEDDTVAGAAPKAAAAPREKGSKRARSPTPTPTEGAPSEPHTAAPSEPTELAGDDGGGSDVGL